MRSLWSEQKIGVEVDHGIGAARAIYSNGNSGACPFAQIAVHAQCDLDVRFVCEKDLTHRHGLQRFLRYLSQHRRRIETDLGALRRRVARQCRQTIVAKHVVHWRLQVGIAETLDDYAVDARNLAVDRLRSLDAHDRSDADRRVDCRPEVELVRRVWFSLGCYDASQRFAHEIALRKSSQSRMP